MFNQKKSYNGNGNNNSNRAQCLSCHQNLLTKTSNTTKASQTTKEKVHLTKKIN